MDENRNGCFWCKHPICKSIFIALLVFFGAFAAFYVVTDWHFKRMLDPSVQMRKVEKMMMNDERQMDKMINRQFKHEKMSQKDIQKYIKVEKTPQNYRIVVDLRHFDNDEKNVEVNTNGNSLMVTAVGEHNKHGHNEIVRISQSFSFDDDTDLSKITKIREGNDYVIVVPLD